MTHERWHHPTLRALSWYLAGDAIHAETHIDNTENTRTPTEPAVAVPADISCLLVLNGYGEDVPVVLPAAPWAHGYRLLVDTAALVDPPEPPALDVNDNNARGITAPIPAGTTVSRPAFSVAVYEALRSDAQAGDVRSDAQASGHADADAQA
jgi:hypothetical protein